jgi:hypothetical protein
MLSFSFNRQAHRADKLTQAHTQFQCFPSAGLPFGLPLPLIGRTGNNLQVLWSYEQSVVSTDYRLCGSSIRNMAIDC